MKLAATSRGPQELDPADTYLTTSGFFGRILSHKSVLVVPDMVIEAWKVSRAWLQGRKLPQETTGLGLREVQAARR